LEACEEHHVVDMVMAEIDGVSYDERAVGWKVTVVKENLEHHIEQEEAEMFNQTKQVFESATHPARRIDDAAQGRADEAAISRAVDPTMSERETQTGDDEVGICHICGETFPSQEMLSRHLMDEHDEDALPPEVLGDS
jgi:Zinc finger, C2H2 type